MLQIHCGLFGTCIFKFHCLCVFVSCASHTLTISVFFCTLPFICFDEFFEELIIIWYIYTCFVEWSYHLFKQYIHHCCCTLFGLSECKKQEVIPSSSQFKTCTSHVVYFHFLLSFWIKNKLNLVCCVVRRKKYDFF